LKGEIGLQSLIDSVEELKSKTLYDNSCALHYHIGGIPRTPEFLLAFYKVSSFFQDEMFSMFPLYKKYNFGVKRKNYSKPFPVNKINSLMDASIDIKNKDQVNNNFNVLFRYLSEGYDFKHYNNDLNNVLEHPRDPNGNQKWNISTRYYANNLIPIIFGNKQTIEFRIHTPTYDIGKIVNFLLFNVYLIDFTVTNLQSILEDPSYIVRIDNFRRFLETYLKSVKLDSSDKKRLLDYHISYISSRVKQTELANTLGIIEGDENKIQCSSYIKWNSIDKKYESDFNEYNFSVKHPPMFNSRTPDPREFHSREPIATNLKSRLKKISKDILATQVIEVPSWMTDFGIKYDYATINEPVKLSILDTE
jgi:hypothetical protein